MAEHGFFVRELNTGWAEWSAAGLPTHSDVQLPNGAMRCTCSLHPELLGGGRAAEQPGEPAAP